MINFANVETIASYYLMSQTINFRDLIKEHQNLALDNVNNGDFSLDFIESLKLFAHEGCHFIDHISTLSGLRMLEKIYSAINEFEYFNSELNAGRERPTTDNIFAFLELFCEWKQQQHSKVFNKLKSNNINIKDWAFNFSGDKVFNIRGEETIKPILTVTFKSSNIPYAKVPFTMESLWETNAIYAELDYQYIALMSIEDDDQRLIEAARIENAYKKYFYDPELFIYSTAAHFTSSFANLGSIFDAFKLSKLLSDISLNLPFKYYNTLKKTKGTIFRGLVNKFLKESTDMQPPIVFMALLENIVEDEDFNIREFLNKEIIDIDTILQINNLPSKNFLKSEIILEMQNINLQVDDIQSKLFLYFKELGVDFFNQLGFNGIYKGFSPSYIKFVCLMDNCVFQGWDVKALMEEETLAFIRQKRFNQYFNLMVT
ncbi:hypothetical protein [Paenibacillus xylanilyticus]|uniref:Uncharacterized protein n=1 Tax=Paenibacillus xylanilyticus TaxID=248903 RepID=A0A7Y6C078_9BACL|nr:hypothetical protein [Paenibacillus xylanilyticus]NUU78177.1 hypothetical protein [Paenibacillus xylanilyticus]